MLNGLYSSATAMEVASKRHEVIANNIANVNTPGFRRTMMSLGVRPNEAGTNTPSTHDDLIGTQELGTYLDMAHGPTRTTNRNLDVAIHGDGFFSIQTDSGTQYTRSGSFHLSNDGTLVTSDGNTVLAGGQAVEFPPGSSTTHLKILSDGTITNGQQSLGQLDIVQFEDQNQLTPVGNNRLRAPASMAAVPAESISVQQGALEQSNAIAVTEMIEMITGMRHYETAQQTLRSISEAIQRYTTFGL